MSHPVLDFDYDPTRWLLGPSDDKPLEQWLPSAVAEIESRFSVPADNVAAREAIQQTLATIGRFEDILSYVIMYWPSPSKRPLPVYFGLEERGDVADADADAWLSGIDLVTVEKPVIDEIEVDRDSVSVRRSLPYSTDAAGHVVVSAQYVVDTGHDDFIVLARAAAYQSADIIEIQQDLERMLSSARIVQWEGPGR